MAEDGQAVAHERLAQRVLQHADRRLGIGRDALAHDLLGDLERELDEVALARCERLLARVARACDELLGECEPLDDCRLGACHALDVAGLEALLARGLRDRLGLLARDGDQRCALLARPLEELVHPTEAAPGGRTAACRTRAAAGVVRGGDGCQPSRARSLCAGDDRSFGHSD